MFVLFGFDVGRAVVAVKLTWSPAGVEIINKDFVTGQNVEIKAESLSFTSWSDPVPDDACIRRCDAERESLSASCRWWRC